MADYDSDSSDGEYTETNVLLGYASRDADDEDIISRLGGRPDWLDPATPPSAALARCKVCKDLLVLLLQLNAELPEKFPDHERRIYVFVCRRAACRRKDGTVRALRGVRHWKEDVAKGKRQPGAAKEEEKEETNAKKDVGPGVGLGDALFGSKGLGSGSSANPFSSNAAASTNTNPFSSNGSSSGSNPFSTSSGPNAFSKEAPPASAQKPIPTEESPQSLSKTFAETLSLNTSPSAPPPPPEPWPQSDAQPNPYPTLYLADAEYETLDPNPTTKVPETARLEDADAPEPSALDREAFESSMDAAFQKFADRLAQNPDQAIRYEFGGTPLLYSKTDTVGEKLTKSTIPGCPNCGGRRTFEVQLTPHAIAELEADDMSLDGMEWGTIIVGVCERDCVPRGVAIGEAGYLEEWAGVQWEELAKNK